MKNSLELKVGELLRKNGYKLAVAESCTGGLIGHRITNIPGSSEYYLGSVTAYAYEAKERFLGVKRETLVEFGAVSRETVIEMASGVRKALAGDFPLDSILGLSVSGIAGPGGGMPGKPVGLVWVGLSTPEGNQAFEFHWNGTRIQNKEHSADAALQELHKYLKKHAPIQTALPERQKRRILILTADAGFGHRSAANAVKAALEERMAAQCHVEIVNPLDDKRVPLLFRDSQADYDKLVRQMPELYRFGYEASDAPVPKVIAESALTVLLFEAVSRILKEQQPDAVLNTYPLYQAPLEAVYTINRFFIPTLTVITDLISVHGLCFYKNVDACLVPNEQVRELAVANGIEREKVWITGIPVHPDIVNEDRKKADIRRQLGWRTDLPTFLAVGNKRMEKLIPALNMLNHSGTPIQLVVSAGKDRQLFDELNSMHWHVPVHLYEFVDHMPAFMHASDAVICKAGGLITTEALACGLPMMIIEAIPGQETGNVDYVVKNNAGFLAEDPIQVLEVLAHWMADSGRLLVNQAENARKLGKPLAAYDVADLLWDAAQARPEDRPARNTTGRRTLIDLLRRNQVRWEEFISRSQ